MVEAASVGLVLPAVSRPSGIGQPFLGVVDLPRCADSRTTDSQVCRAVARRLVGIRSELRSLRLSHPLVSVPPIHFVLQPTPLVERPTTIDTSSRKTDSANAQSELTGGRRAA